MVLAAEPRAEISNERWNVDGQCMYYVVTWPGMLYINALYCRSTTKESAWELAWDTINRIMMNKLES